MDNDTDYEALYREMRAGATRVEGELFQRFVKACQRNLWLCVGGADFEPEGYCNESDYAYYLERYEDRGLLRRFFEHGNWSIRAAVQFGDLIFANQVNGGDEWWTLKIEGDQLVDFESLSMRHIIAAGNFDSLLDRMLGATAAQCKAWQY